MIGKKINYLTVLKEAVKDKWGGKRYLCECECGNKRIKRSSDLKQGKVKSCGCKRGWLKGKSRVDKGLYIYSHLTSEVRETSTDEPMKSGYNYKKGYNFKVNI